MTSRHWHATRADEGLTLMRQALASDAVNPAAVSDWQRMVDSLPTGRAYGVRAWFQAAAGRTVTTHQWAWREGALRTAWAPGERVVDKVTPTLATMDGSRVDYAGSWAVVSDASTLVILRVNDFQSTLIAYRIVGE